MIYMLALKDALELNLEDEDKEIFGHTLSEGLHLTSSTELPPNL